MEPAGERSTTDDAHVRLGIPPIIARIFPINSRFLEVSSQDLKLQTSEDAVSDIVIIGDRQCRHKLLFQAAISYIVEGATVCYIRSHPLDVLPPSVHGMTLPKAAFGHRLKMMYLQTVDELIDYLSSIHQEAALPEILLLEDLTFYTSQSMDEDESKAIAKLSALLLDSTHYLSTKSDRSRARIAIGMHNVPKNIKQVLSSFFKNIFMVQDLGESKFTLSASKGSENQALNDKEEMVSHNYNFYVKDHQVLLDTITK